MSLVACSCNNKETVKLYLIPKGYEGPLIIIEDEKQNDSFKKKNDTLIFDFRKSNILRLKGKFVDGTDLLSNLKYYYVDSFNNRILIPIFLGNATNNLDSNQVYMFTQFTQVSSRNKLSNGASQCDLITSPKNFKYNSQQQIKVYNTLIAMPVDTVH